MALFLPGISICPICETVINENEKIISFSAFIFNTKDPLAIFSDSVCHEFCVNNHLQGEEAIHRADLISQKANPWSNCCIVCEQIIDTPDEYFSLGYFTNNCSCELYKYNCIQMHKKHIAEWIDLLKVYNMIIALEHSGKWGGDWLKYILSELTKYLPK